MMSDALLSRSPSREQGDCWRCSRTRCRDIDVTVFGVSTWNNGDVSGECSYLVSSGGAHFCSVLHLSFSTSSGRRNIRVPFLFYISSTSFEPIPVQPKTRGIGDKSSSIIMPDSVRTAAAVSSSGNNVPGTLLQQNHIYCCTAVLLIMYRLQQ